jgi:hydroxyacylglutathione hydrolase
VVVFSPDTNLYAKAAFYIGQKVMRPLCRFPPVEPGIVISEDFSLEPFGIPGAIIPTPGHTGGSLSVLLSSGQAFVGDLASNYLAFGLGPILPPFSENIQELRRSWHRLLSSGVIIICPSHGKPFKAELLRRKLQREGRVTIEA